MILICRDSLATAQIDPAAPVVDVYGVVQADGEDPAKPLRYRRLTEGIVIYSVGPDLTDDGGNLDRQNRVGPGTDVGVQLWDVNERRQSPAPETTK